jgi:peptide/nickel transport system permease protein
MSTRETAIIDDADRDEILELPELTQFQLVWGRFRHHKLAVFGLFVIALFGLLCFAAPWVAPYSFEDQDLLNRFGAPTLAHWLGTDVLGRDTLTRLMYAGRISLTVSLAVTLITAIIGTIVGAVAAYFGRAIEMFLMRFTDIMLALPTLPLLLLSSKMLRDQRGLSDMFGGSLSVMVVVVVLTLLGWMNVTRLVHGSVLSLKQREFVEAARALGASPWRIIVNHLIPNSMAPIIVAATLGLGQRIIIEASLSFLGLGIMPPVPSWGNMLNDVQGYMWRNPWLAFYPGACIFIVVLAFNFIGDGLRDALDPRLRI